MNILIVTPYYRIEGRSDLMQDTCAVYYLVRPWAKEHNVRVIYIYRNNFRRIGRYLNGEARRYYSNGYEYQSDGVDVFLVEEQRLYRQPLAVDIAQGMRIRRMISDYLLSHEFIPELVITHIPTETDGMLQGMFPEADKVAVLHSTDVKVCQHNRRRFELLSSNHDRYFARSRSIYDYFLERGVDNLSDELVISGVPKETTVVRNFHKPKLFRILYVGKFIQRKHIDLTIKALAALKNSYSFRFDLYGAGREEKKIKLLAQKLLGDLAAFHGQVPRDEVLRQMEKADIFVMPSTQETFGLVYIEAMSKGCIPIGVAGEGADGVIDDAVNGYLVYPNDLYCLIEKISSIFQMSETDYEALVKRVLQSGNFYNERDMGYRYLEMMIGA